MLKNGKLPQGTGIGVYGYQWIKEYKKRIPLEREAKIVQRMFEMVAQGDSCFKIARTMNEESIPTKSGKKWEPRTVSRIVRSPAYTGVTYFGQTSGKEHRKMPQESWHVLTDVTPAIISQELFERAQAALARSRELHPGKAMHEYPLTGFAVCGYCGSPLIGSCLRGNYRYYHCRGTYPTASRKKICDARYIQAGWLESVAWEKVKGVLRHPETLLAEIRKQTEAEQSRVSSGTIEEEIKALKRKLKQYSGQERRLMQAFKLGFTPDVILDEMNQTKKEKGADQARLAALVRTKENIAKTGDFEAKLKALCTRIAPDLDNCANEDKKDAYTYLDLEVTATPEGVDIRGYLDSSVLTTARTSGLQLIQTYACDLVTGHTQMSTSVVPRWG